MVAQESTSIRSFPFKGDIFEFDTNSLHFTSRSRGSVPGGAIIRGGRTSSNEVPRPEGINFVTLNVAHDCNMACPYCFAKEGLYGGPRQLMNEATALRCVDWLLKVSGDHRDCFLRFLGGEPFLNVPVMRRTMEYGCKIAAETGKRIHFSINTNGTIFDSEIDELLREFSVTISISMDGTEEAHNQFRIFRSGRGTYDTVARNVPKFLAADPHAMVNATLTSENVELFDYAVHFRELGFRIIRFAMVGTAVPGIAVRRDQLLDRIRENYDRLADRYLADLRRGDVWYLADFYKYFENLRFLRQRHNRCGAGTSYVNIDVNGDVHLCHRFTADKTQKIGDITRELKDLAVPESIRRMNQLLPTNGSVPSHALPVAAPRKDSKLPLPLVMAANNDVAAAPVNAVPVAEHHLLDGGLMFEQRGSQAGGFNPCSVCDIRYLCGGMCFHDGEILHADLFGGPDVFKCEVDRHLAKIAIWLVDRIEMQNDDTFVELDRLHHCSAQRTKGEQH
jgi:sulfatase maturation enzyme AslB (radical SAM superfamily)